MLVALLAGDSSVGAVGMPLYATDRSVMVDVPPQVESSKAMLNLMYLELAELTATEEPDAAVVVVVEP